MNGMTKRELKEWEAAGRFAREWMDRHPLPGDPGPYQMVEIAREWEQYRITNPRDDT